MVKIKEPTALDISTLVKRIKNTAEGIPEFGQLAEETRFEEAWQAIKHSLRILISRISTKENLKKEMDELIKIYENPIKDPKKLAKICNSILVKLKKK